MVTFDKLPLRDVLVYRLQWSEEDARAFLDALEAPTKNLATKEDKEEVQAVRAELAAFRREFDRFRVEQEGFRAEQRADMAALEQRLMAHIDRRIEETDRRLDELERRLMAQMRAMVRAAELRMAALYLGGFGVLVGLILSRS